MILNLSRIKTEALLLFCKDIILSYKDSNDNLFEIDTEIKDYINSISDEMLREITKILRPNDFYQKNLNNSQVKAVVLSYEHLNKSLSKELKKESAFNPSMLYFSLLASWFAELEKERTNKAFIYFTIYPYSNVYDKLLLEIKNEEYKKLNISMINIAERVIKKLDNYKFR